MKVFFGFIVFFTVFIVFPAFLSFLSVFQSFDAEMTPDDVICMLLAVLCHATAPVDMFRPSSAVGVVVVSFGPK